MRLVYVDYLKGLAIFLMVMGHFLSWSFEGGLPTHDMPIRIVRDFIYAFHMPLFMFMSGYVVDLNAKNFISNTAIYQLVKKRMRTLMIPSITALIMGYVLRDGFLELPWFLTALFFISLLFCLIQMVCIAFKARKWFLYAFLCGGYFILFVLNKSTEGSITNEFLSLTQTQIMYPYFVLGYLFHRFDAYRFFKQYHVYTFSLIGFCFFSIFTISSIGAILSTPSSDII